MVDKHNIRYAKLYASINCIHWINHHCVSIFLPFFLFLFLSPPFLFFPVFITRDQIWMCSHVYTQVTIQQRRKIGENDEKKKKNNTFYQPQMEHHLSSFQLFYFRAGGFIYCGVIEIAVDRGKNYIETAGASRKLSRLPNGGEMLRG